MDPALAAQMSEAVAEKVLQYRRDESGWKICREAVSAELGRKGSRAPWGWGLRRPQAPPLPATFLLSSTLELDRVGVDSTEGRFLKKPRACLHHDPGRCGSVPFSE